MFFNSKIISLFLAFVISFFTSAFIYISKNYSGNFFVLPIIVFVISFLLVFITLEYFVFSQINEIYTLLEKIKKKNYDIHINSNSRTGKKKKRNELVEAGNPLYLIKEEIAEFAEAKQKEINELKKLETFRREFLADVSHELKTPIFAAQGFVHTLIDGAMYDVEVRDRFLNKAATSLDGLNVLVEDLITISQLEIGEIKMQYQNFDIAKLSEDIYEQLEETAKKRFVKLKFYKYSPKSVYVYADKYRIGQVLTNLIVNAIKYGKEKGTVVISFIVENESVYAYVKDDGPGIEEKHLNRIFERFYRIEKSRSKDKGGTGLGLSIVKHILEAHESKITVSSSLGEGTVFSFKLVKGKVINEKG